MQIWLKHYPKYILKFRNIINKKYFIYVISEFEKKIAKRFFIDNNKNRNKNINLIK